MKTKTATTVKIEKSLYDNFKILGIQNNLTLQTFVDKCVHLYVGDTSASSSFRTLVNNFIVPVLSDTTGSFGS
jgi:predicted DNA-binding ribbon-helix-helix protein